MKAEELKPIQAPAISVPASSNGAAPSPLPSMH